MKYCYGLGRNIRLLLVAVTLLAGAERSGAVDLGVPPLSPPLQQEKFFDTERLSTGGESSTAPGHLEPQLGLSHSAREDEGSVGTTQTTHRIHGEAGGKVNLLENVSLSAVAKVPLYTYENRLGQASTSEGRGAADIMRNPGSNLSWRSELGVNLGEGMDINLFYDRSLFGGVDRQGGETTDEKFGTRFIIHFK